MFESSVNPEGIQTRQELQRSSIKFESSVNPEGIQTIEVSERRQGCLRVV